MEDKNKKISIPDVFKILGLEHKEDRSKYIFGSTTLENPKPEIKIEHVIRGRSLKEIK